MSGKIFVNYRRDDARDMAARIRDRLAQTFGDDNVFMDVDNLIAGQRFDVELKKALSETDVFVAVIGPRWVELLAKRRARGERDYVREEIAEALQRGIIVIPALIERTPLPRADALPAHIRDLVLHQKHEVSHERFGRDVADLVNAIQFGRQAADSKAEHDWRGGDSLVQGANYGRREHAFESCRREPGKGKLRCFRDTDISPEMAVVPAGSFMMGSNNHGSETPPHTVRINTPFAVGRLPVTFAEWDAAALPHRPSDRGWGRDRRPVINVSWEDAKAYVSWLSQKTEKAYRLLSEAEWEYCCRAGTTTTYAFGDTITRLQAQFSAKEATEVGKFPPNAWGLYDMHGNVWEWCEDNWHADYQGAPQDGSIWQGGDASLRVIRGGSWGVYADHLRSAIRSRNSPEFRADFIGFRVARGL